MTQATGTAGFSIRRMFRVLGAMWQKQSEENLSLIAAGIAFYSLLSLFPGITAAVALAGVVIEPTVMVENSEDITALMPQEAEGIVKGQLEAVAATDNSSLSFAAILAVCVSLYSASRAVANFMVGLNMIYELPETRGFFHIRALTVLMTFVAIIGLILTIVIVAAFPVIASVFNPFGWVDDLILLLRWPFLFFMGVFGIALLYRYGPDRKRRARTWITSGALVACTLWVAGSYVFSRYVQSFGSYNETFGALGGVIILLSWLWLSAFVVLIGALMDTEIVNSRSEPGAIKDAQKA